MRKRTSKRLDVVQNARRVVDESIRRAEAIPTPAPKVTRSMVSQVMAAMGRKGGKIGGKRRLVTLTPERRSELATAAVRARWDKRKP